MKISFEPIGIMHCDLKTLADVPFFYEDSSAKGIIEIYEPYVEGLIGLEEIENIVVLFHFHLSKGYELMQRKKGHGELKGVFRLCSPRRPNPIGMSVLKLTKVASPLLYVEHVDMVDGTPILDIKPYFLPGEHKR
jgi:tRNA-Thr(GGU) m(6)t(6)A37 methyltransferase TsaA